MPPLPRQLVFNCALKPILREPNPRRRRRPWTRSVKALSTFSAEQSRRRHRVEAANSLSLERSPNRGAAEKESNLAREQLRLQVPTSPGTISPYSHVH